MKIYHYDRNKVYTGVSEARKDPLEKGKFLIPAHATTLKPAKAKSGFGNIFNGEEWAIVRIKKGRPSKYHTWSEADGWTITEEDQVKLDADNNATAEDKEYQRLIQKEIILLAVKSLIAQNKLPSDYEERL